MRAAAFIVAISIVILPVRQSLAQDAAAGEKVFAKCKACHVVEDDKNKIGPSLKGVVGRKAGVHEGFKYSKAMHEAGEKGLVWDDASIDEYLLNPKEFLKGNKMAFAGLKKDDERANIIAYLKGHP